MINKRVSWQEVNNPNCKDIGEGTAKEVRAFEDNVTDAEVFSFEELFSIGKPNELVRAYRMAKGVKSLSDSIRARTLVKGFQRISKLLR